jgi:hypothetical protein
MQAALWLALDQAPAAAAWIEQSLRAAHATGQTVSGLRARRVAALVEAARRHGTPAKGDYPELGAVQSPGRGRNPARTRQNPGSSWEST